MDGTLLGVNNTHNVNVSVAWIVVPPLIGSLLYMATALASWPYTRPFFPIWFLIVALFFPPFFIGILLYVLIVFICMTPPIAQPVVIIVGPSTRGRVRPTMTPSFRRGTSV